MAREILSVAIPTIKKVGLLGLGISVDSLDTISQSYQESLITTKDISLPVKYRFYADMPLADTINKGYNSKGYWKVNFLIKFEMVNGGKFPRNNGIN